MFNFFIVASSLLAASSVAADAFGAHALRNQISDRNLEIFEIGARYQMYHSLALLGVGILLNQAVLPAKMLSIAGFAFLGGIFVFSGSLYAYTMSGIKWLGAITPFGGFAFVLGWACMVLAAFGIGK